MTQMQEKAYEFLSSLPKSEQVPRKIKTSQRQSSELWVSLKDRWPDIFETRTNRKTPWATLDRDLRRDKRFLVDGGFVVLKEWNADIPDAVKTDDESRIHLSKSEKQLQARLFEMFRKTRLKEFGFKSLRLVDESEQKEKHGKYNTGEVGEMDFLLKDISNNFIVIEIKKKEEDRAIGQICRYMGWVKANLCNNNQSVKGIILTREMTDRLRYAQLILSPQIEVHVWFG